MLICYCVCVMTIFALSFHNCHSFVILYNTMKMCSKQRLFWISFWNWLLYSWDKADWDDSMQVYDLSQTQTDERIFMVVCLSIFCWLPIYEMMDLYKKSCNCLSSFYLNLRLIINRSQMESVCIYFCGCTDPIYLCYLFTVYLYFVQLWKINLR